jgi:uncharacterized membrane protein
VQATAMSSWRAGGRSPRASIADECTIGELPKNVLDRARRRLPIRVVFSSLALLWPAAMISATRIAALPHQGAATYVLAAAVYISGSLLCHQRPERSFYVWGAQFPVCARCTGIYVGAAFGVIASWVRLTPDTTTNFVPSGSSRTSVAASGFMRTARLTLFAAVLPTALTLVFEWTTGAMPANSIRALAGLILGAAAAIVVMRAAGRNGS